MMYASVRSYTDRGCSEANPIVTRILPNADNTRTHTNTQMRRDKDESYVSKEVMEHKTEDHNVES